MTEISGTGTLTPPRRLGETSWILLFLLFFSTAQTTAKAQDVAPGARFELRAEDLPAPKATPSAINPPARALAQGTPELKTLPGFTANVFAEGFDDARWLTVAENGDVFLAESGVGRIILLRDKDNDGKADTIVTYAEGFRGPHGMALHKRWLYVADTQRVRRLPYRPGLIRPAGPTQLVTAAGALGPGDGHWTRNIAFHPDGTHFYIAIGSGGNLDEEPPPRASVQEFTLDASHRESFATGLRNPVGIAFYPGTKDLYVVVNERDKQGDGLVPDYLTRITRDGFYGWPYAYTGPHPQPRYADKRPDLVEKTILPDLLFESHSAPLGLVFYDGTQFPRTITAMPSWLCTDHGTQRNPEAIWWRGFPSRMAARRGITRPSLPGAGPWARKPPVWWAAPPGLR